MSYLTHLNAEERKYLQGLDARLAYIKDEELQYLLKRPEHYHLQQWKGKWRAYGVNSDGISEVVGLGHDPQGAIDACNLEWMRLMLYHEQELGILAESYKTNDTDLTANGWRIGKLK